MNQFSGRLVVKRVLVAVVLACGVVAQAQEIGTEITPVTPGGASEQPKPNQPSDNPYAAQPTDKPAPKAEAPSAAGQLSARQGAFGIRASFSGQSIGLITTGGAGAAPVDTGSAGLSYWATDAFTLLFDLGFGLGLSGASVLVGFGATVGMDYHFRTAADALRPLINVQVGIGSAIAADIGNAMQLSAQFGGGAEYFFSPSFSIVGKVGLGLRVGFASSRLTLMTFTPSVGAAWYF